MITHLAIYQNREKSCMFFQKNLKKKKKELSSPQHDLFPSLFLLPSPLRSNVRNIPIEIMNRDEF